ncbi:hypothetical protein IGI37_003003 [Enterococcus sp. AZ194]|uniref:hypothetical protein n=1 Tax=Enterococcus sp. AZ194 TaxID=2774629 RepID=UPI003F25BF0E
MKKILITFQDRLMDIVILSGIVLIGTLSVIGATYSLVLAFTYLNDEKDRKWQAVFKLKTFVTSVLIELGLLLSMGIVYLNFQLLNHLTGIGRLLIFSMLLSVILILIPLFFSILWLTAQHGGLTKQMFKYAFYCTLIKFPLWLGFTLVLLLMGLLVYLDKALIILISGLIVALFNRLMKRTTNQISVVRESPSL